MALPFDAPAVKLIVAERSPKTTLFMVGASGTKYGVVVTEVNEAAPFPAPFTALK